MFSINDETRLRLLTLLAMLPLLVVVWFGGWLAAILYLLIGGVMAHEIVTATNMNLRHPRGVAIALAIIVPSIALVFFPIIGVIALLLGGIVLLVAGFSLAMRVLSVLVMLAVAGALWLNFFQPEIPWMVVIAAVVTVTDIVAYSAGKFLGGPQLSPLISPSKTWTGAIIGATSGVLMAIFVGSYFGVSASMMVLVGVLLSCGAIIGDLLESYFKRVHDVKDSGNLLPGHGGVLDRFDGYLLVVPLLAFVIL